MLRSVMILAALGACVCGAVADDGALENGIRVDASGRLVSIDPVLRANLIAQLHATLQANGTPAVSGPVRVLADGTESMTLGAEHATFVVSRIAFDDTLETSCVHGAQAAATFLAQTPSSDVVADTSDER